MSRCDDRDGRGRICAIILFFAYMITCNALFAATVYVAYYLSYGH